MLLLSGTVLLGQQQVYEDVYRAAMEDGLISEDEARLLESLQLSLGLEEDQVLEIRQMIDTGDRARGEVYSRAGRRRIIAHNMGYGNGLYGWGIPYVLGVEEGSAWAGMQLLSFAGGLYLSLKYTAEMDLPLGRANFQIAGSSLGLLSLYPLLALIGADAWQEFDPDFKFGTTYMMAAVPLGMRYGDRMYGQLQPSDGQSTATIGGAILGGLHGFLGHLAFTDENSNVGDNWLRLNSLMLTGGLAGGGYLGWMTFKDLSLSSGDAYFLGIGASIGAVNFMEIMAIIEPETVRSALLSFLVVVDLHIYAAYRMGRPYDLTLGEVAIISMGAAAGNAAFRGVALVAGANQGSDAMLVGDVITRLAGAYLTFKSLDPLQDGAALGGSRTQLSLAPAMLGSGLRPVPGLSLSLRF